MRKETADKLEKILAKYEFGKKYEKYAFYKDVESVMSLGTFRKYVKLEYDSQLRKYHYEFNEKELSMREALDLLMEAKNEAEYYAYGYSEYGEWGFDEDGSFERLYNVEEKNGKFFHKEYFKVIDIPHVEWVTLKDLKF